jgi:hypothetical protein
MTGEMREQILVSLEESGCTNIKVNPVYGNACILIDMTALNSIHVYEVD